MYQFVTMLENGWNFGVTTSTIMHSWKRRCILLRVFDNMEAEEGNRER